MAKTAYSAGGVIRQRIIDLIYPVRVRGESLWPAAIGQAACPAFDPASTFRAG